VFDANLLVQYVDQKSTKWSSGLTMYACANHRQVTVLLVAMCFKYRLQRLLLGDFTWHAVWYWRFCVRQRCAVRQRFSI